ncbi:spermidine synthase [Actinopolymorpha alba]|uniref:spermidine synthase n=1 Tax=Actinopolymorpha alba TaxID=533267 RepID=UPI000371FB82|nr:fused MFS/spermidine synthase [Actinopolymorpha alba]
MTGSAEITVDRDDPAGWFVVVNGVPSSYVHLDDPTRLEFEYVRWIGDLIDLMAPPAAPLRVAHLGGAGCTLARYVEATRPSSRQVVFEVDATLVELVRDAFELRRQRGLRIRVTDARAGVRTLGEASQDLVIRDAFAGNRVPEHLTTMEFCREVARILSADGVYVTNVADQAEHRNARAEAATMLEVFAHVVLVAEPSQLRGRRYGNVLLLASNAPLPLDDLTRRLASGAVRARLVRPERLGQLVAGLRPLTDPPEAGALEAKPASAGEEGAGDGADRP